MRCGEVIGAVLFVLALGAADAAEARGRGGGRRPSRGDIVRVSTISPAAATSHDRDRIEPRLRPVKPVAAPTQLQREVRAAEPWCANRRVVGSGTGFCMIN